MTINSEKVKAWRKRTKNRIICAMGYKCCICGYNKCQSALVLHHIDPSQKEFSFGAIRANSKSWAKIVIELRKCILLCHNCHSEIHEGLIFIPNDVPLFNEEFVSYDKDLKPKYDKCPICKKNKKIKLKYCSRLCTYKSFWKIDWDSINLQIELQKKTVSQLARDLGCSDNAIYKRLRKLGLKINK